MKALVIGGSGFLGSHVADQLTDQGYDVTIYDRTVSPYIKNNQKFILGDILDSLSIEESIKENEIVYNFAALADLNDALNKPIDTVNVNILGNVYVLEACRKYKIKRFMYASSVYVYSREGGFYRCSKQASEHYIEEYNRSFGLNYTILRYGSLYGPRSDNSNGLYRIVKSALQTRKLQYQGHPDSLREYIHVEDAARASVSALSEEFQNQSVVLTGQEPMKVVELIKMLGEILNMNDSIEFIENYEVGHYIRTPYAYQPKLGRKYIPPYHVDLGQGLLELIEDVRIKENL